jgi:aspartyl-tRNA(Asn)/glutamyl-tRNA(Gln) amidotransferase subunit A
VHKAADILAAGGGHVEPVEEPLAPEISTTWITLMTYGMKEVSGMIDITEIMRRRDELDPRFSMLLDLPSPEPTTFLQAEIKRAILTREFLQHYERFDVILTPVLPTTAPVGDQGPVVDGQQQQLVYSATPLYLAVLTGDPAVVVPVANGADGLPIGVQIHARRGNDTLALSAALSVEKAVKVKGPRG